MSVLRTIIFSCFLVPLFIAFVVLVYQVTFFFTALETRNTLAQVTPGGGQYAYGSSLSETDPYADVAYAGWCSKSSDCTNARQVCVESKCTCPIIYSGSSDCLNATTDLTVGVSEASPVNSTTPLRWCSIPFNHDRLFPINPTWVGAKGDPNAILLQATKGRDVDLRTMADFSSCAVVGSSGKLLTNRKVGSEIDGYTAVIRFNDAPTRGFESYVGAKTTVRVQNIEYCGYKESDGEILLHYTDPKRSHFARCIDKDIHKISPRMLSYSQNYFLKARPPPPYDPTNGKVKMSGGFYGIMLAMHLCGKVAIYGFGQTPDHYYQKGRKQAGATPFKVRHAWTYEHRCLSELANSDSKRIKLYELY